MVALQVKLASGSPRMRELVAQMEACPQTATQSVMAHGRSVWHHFCWLYAHLKNGHTVPDWWRLPAWVRQPGLMTKLAPLEVIEEYLLFHDCGKPSVLTIDEDGKRHFPGHAQASQKIWLAAGGSPEAARLMAMDMDAHLLKGADIEEFASRPEAVTLLFAALAEVHSNAAMFGGGDSDSFKIKAKHLDKRGRQVLCAMAV